jgi:hypothetical protein
MKKIAVLYIGLGKYLVLWPEFYQSAKLHFFTHDSVHYFLFTDSHLISKENNLSVIPTKDYGWPGNTLYRFSMFDGIAEQLKNFDYVFFFNGNAFFMKDVSDDILPDSSNLVSVRHFKEKTGHHLFTQYERHKKSAAYVKWGTEPPDYVQACLIGATGSKMVEMSHKLSENIKIDEKKGICAIWHDESHFNWFVKNNGCRVLPLSYAYPESVHPENVKPIILMRDKTRYADLNVLRFGKKRNFFQTILFHIHNKFVVVNAFFHFPQYFYNKKKAKQ